MADLTDQRVKSAHDVLQKELADRVDVPDDRRFAGFDAYRHAIDCLRPGDVAFAHGLLLLPPRAGRVCGEEGRERVHGEELRVRPGRLPPHLGGGARRRRSGTSRSRPDFSAAIVLPGRCSFEKIRAGELGDIPLVRATRDCGRDFLGKPPAGADLVAWQINNRVHFLWAGSGLMLELLIHQIDECCWIKDGWPVSATGKCTPPNKPGNCSQNVDDYVMEYTFVDGGKAVVEGIDPFAHVHPRQQARRAQFSGNVHARHRAYLQGQGDRQEPDRLGPRPRELPAAPWQAEWKDFLEAIREDRPYNEAERAAYANLAGIMGPRGPPTWAGRSPGRRCSPRTSDSRRSSTS